MLIEMTLTDHDITIIFLSVLITLGINLIFKIMEI